MAQQDTTTPPGGMRFHFGQAVVYFANAFDASHPHWCPAVVINPIEVSGEVAVAYWHPQDGFQWTDRARVSDVKPIPDDLETQLDRSRDKVIRLLRQIEDAP